MESSSTRAVTCTTIADVSARRTLPCDVDAMLTRMDGVQMHMVKNFLVDNVGLDKHARVPLILGIWGAKGQGKSFQCELAFKKLG